MKVRLLVLLTVMFIGLVYVSNGWAPGPTSYKYQHVGK
jgi:hypothetical protein